METVPNFSFPSYRVDSPSGSDGMFGGMGGFGGLLFGLLLGNRGGGLFGNNQDPMAALALGQLSDIKSSIPLAASEIKTAVAQSENALSNQANQNLLATMQAINAVGSKVDASTITQLQTELAHARAGYHARANDLNISQTVNQAQTQGQIQTQLNGLQGILSGLVVQQNRATQDIVNLGSMTGSGTQTTVQR